jgi:hypothetical protein
MWGSSFVGLRVVNEKAGGWTGLTDHRLLWQQYNNRPCGETAVFAGALLKINEKEIVFEKTWAIWKGAREFLRSRLGRLAIRLAIGQQILHLPHCAQFRVAGAARSAARSATADFNLAHCFLLEDLFLQ